MTENISLWREVVAGIWHPELPYLAGMVLALSALLLYFRREDRATVYHTLGFYAVGLGGLALAALLSALGITTGGAVAREAAVIACGIAIVRLWGLFIFRVAMSWLRLPTPRIVEDLLVIVAYAAWGMVRLRYAGLDLSQIVTTSALITAVLAFSMQETLGNLLGGVALELDSSLNVGDWVRVDDVEGQVVDIRWRSTSVVTRNGDTVVFPNSYLMRNRFAIHGRSGHHHRLWRRAVGFNVALSARPAAVCGAVHDAVRDAAIAYVAHDPAPQCLLMDFENGYGRYALRYWLADFSKDDATDAAVRSCVLAALQRNGMRLAVAEYSLHMTEENEAHLDDVRSRDIAHRLQALKQVDLFQTLGETELRKIAERLVFTPFAKGDVMTHQGAVAHWLYILTAGEAEVKVAGPEGVERTVARLTPATCFGEMGLLTGEPRRATVSARTDVECYRLDKASLEDLMHARPALAEELSHLLAVRLHDLHRKLRDANAADESRHANGDRHEILQRIRDFFGLAPEPARELASV